MSSKYVRNSEGLFVCCSCNVVKEKQSTMCEHVKRHEDNQFECQYCNKKFTRKHALDLHLLSSKHKDSNSKKTDSFKCPFEGCDFESVTKANRRIHCMRKHFKNEINNIIDDDNTCLTCKNTFRSSSAFYYHALECIRVNNSEMNKIIEEIT